MLVGVPSKFVQPVAFAKNNQTSANEDAGRAETPEIPGISLRAIASLNFSASTTLNLSVKIAAIV